MSTDRTFEGPILEVKDLHTTFYTDKETIHAVDGVSFALYPGQVTGIVGESGSGKSVTARSIMGLVKRPGQIDAGEIRFRQPDTVKQFATDFQRHTSDLTADEPIDDETFVVIEERTNGEITSGYVDIAGATEDARRRLRGGNIAMVFQDPLSSLNPVYTIGNQIKEALRLHQGLTGAAATEEAIDLLEAVGIPDAPRRVSEYPHQFSGGMRQRAVIAMALAGEPDVLIADEPTTALDVTIQAQILELLKSLTEERDLSIMFITHDMGVIAEMSDRVNVMYAGEVVESAPVEPLFASPDHPYTRGLLKSIPGRQVGADRLETIEGEVPTPTENPTYCRFAPRCPKAFDACEQVHPEPVAPQDDVDPEHHRVSCLLYPDNRAEADRVAYHQQQGDDT